MKLKVYSEIGKLKKVLVHRPGKEVERIYPEIFERLLFDDIMHLDVAREEHDFFTDKLREEGIEVFYIEKLVAEVLDANPSQREKFVKAYLDAANIGNKTLYEASKKHFLDIKNNLELVEATIAGLQKSDIDVKFTESLSDQVLAEDEYPFYIDPIPNILFQRDPIASIFDGMNLHNMSKVTRKREKVYYEFGLKMHKDFKSIKYHLSPDHEGTMEGGDILVISKETIFVGLSERTTPKAVESLAKVLFGKYNHLKRVIGIEIPKSHATMHLDTVLTQMDVDKFSVDAEMAIKKYVLFEITKGSKDKVNVAKSEDMIINILKKYVHPDPKLVVVGGGQKVRAKREQWNDGANCLCIAPGKIVVYNRNKYTNELIRKAGVQTIEVLSSELSRGRGGPRCMSMPLEREEV